MQVKKEYLSDDYFATVIQSVPLVSIDLVITCSNYDMLVGFRKNRPAKDYWFVPGGRIRKNESINDAFERITELEIGTIIERKNTDFIGYFEHFYAESSYSTKVSTHYIVLAFLLKMKDFNIDKLPVDQHSRYIWLSDKTDLSKYKVHKYSMNYFNKLLKK